MRREIMVTNETTGRSRGRSLLGGAGRGTVLRSTVLRFRVVRETPTKHAAFRVGILISTNR